MTMKKLLAMMFALVMALSVQALERRDTIVIVNGDTVKNTTKQRAYDKYKKADFLDFDLALGFSAPTGAPDGLGFAPFRSTEWTIGLRYKYTPKKALQTYSVGLWAKWSSYALSKDKMFVMDDSHVVGVGAFPDKSSSKRSAINIFSLSVPFLFTQKFGHKSCWSFTLGPVVNFNLKGRINNEYTVGDYENDIYVKGIEYRPVTIDLMGMVTYKKVSAYFKYSPMSVLKKDMGPQFHALSFGVML